MAKPLQAPALDPASLPPRTGSSYPETFNAPCIKREKRKLGDALGLESFGVNLTRLNSGDWSAQRHWHSHEDEFIYILEGEATLVTDAVEQQLGPGMVAGFPAGRADGHHLVNRSDAPVLYLEVGDRRPGEDEAHYPDIDLHLPANPEGFFFTNKKGEPY